MKASLQIFTHTCLVPIRKCCQHFWKKILSPTIFDACVQSCSMKTSRRMQFHYYYSSYTIHLLSMLRTAAKNNYNLEYISKLREDDNQSELDKTLLIDSLSPHSTRTCFKNLRSPSNLLPNQTHWQNLSANSSKTIANLFNFFLLYQWNESLCVIA